MYDMYGQWLKWRLVYFLLLAARDLKAFFVLATGQASMSCSWISPIIEPLKEILSGLFRSPFGMAWVESTKVTMVSMPSTE